MSNLRLVGLFAAVVSIMFLSSAQGSQPQLVAIPGVDVSELARCGNLQLLVPDGTPQVSAEEARVTAEAAGGPFDLPVQQTVLARLAREPSELVYSDSLVWVVVLSDGAVHELDGPSGPGFQDGSSSARRPATFTYAVVLVDALSGEIALGTFGPANPDYVANVCPP